MIVQVQQRFRRGRGHGRCRGDDGVTLLLALAFITVLGVLITGLLALTDTSFKTTQVTRSRVDSLYAADGGADHALEQIRTTAPSVCPPAITAVPAINGVVPAVTVVSCTGGTTTTGGSSILNPYAAIALGTSGISVGGSSADGDNLTVRFLGDIFSAGPVAPVPGAGNKLSVEGNASLTASTCPFNAATNPQVTGSCLASQVAPAVSQTSPKVVVPTTARLSPVNGTGANSNCTIVYPGKHTNAQTFSSTRGYYFASGTYYFSGGGDVNLNGRVRGGAVGASTATLSASFDALCPADFANDASAKAQTNHSAYDYTGSGVTIVLGGNTKLRVADTAAPNDARIELFPRVPAAGSPDLAATPGVSIWAQIGSTAGVTVPANYAPITNTDSYTTNGKIADIVTHGLAWLPQSVLSIAPLPNAEAGGAAQFEGGVVGKQLSLLPNSISGGLTATIAGSSTTIAIERAITITSTATPIGGGAATTVKVVATYPTTANGYPTIVSWRQV